MEGGGCLGRSCFKSDVPQEMEEGNLAHAKRSRAFSVMLLPDPGSGDAAVAFDIEEEEDEMDGIVNEDANDSMMAHGSSSSSSSRSKHHHNKKKKKTRFEEPEKHRKSSSSNLISSLLSFFPFRKRESSDHHGDEDYDNPRQKHKYHDTLEDDESIDNDARVRNKGRLEHNEDYEEEEDGANKRNRKALYDRGRQQSPSNTIESSKQNIEEEFVEKELLKCSSVPKEFKLYSPERDEKQNSNVDEIKQKKTLCKVNLTNPLNSSVHDLIGGFLFLKSKDSSSHGNYIRVIKLDPFMTKSIHVQSDEPLTMKKIDSTIDDDGSLDSYLVPCYLDPLTQEVQVLYDSIRFRSTIIIIQILLFIFVVLWISVPEALPFVPAT